MRISARDGNRTRIKALVSLLPGLHLRLLQRLTGISFNSTRYHVAALSKKGEIIRWDDGGYSRLYPLGTTQADMAVFSAIWRGTDRRILTILSRNTTMTQREICDVTGLAKSTVSEHLAHLTKVGMIRNVPIEGERSAYVLVDPSRIRELLKVQHARRLRGLTMRFIDLWDF